MTRAEAIEVVKELLSQRLAELTALAGDLGPGHYLPACTRRQLRNVPRWAEIVGGSDLAPGDMPDILSLIEAKLDDRRLAHKLATGAFSNFVDEATAVAAQEWERYDHTRLALKLAESAAVLIY